jgi:two-component system response regulator HydG
LFLDEIGNLTYENQVQLLRTTGAKKLNLLVVTKAVDIRIITATNEDLREAVKMVTFVKIYTMDQ